MKYTKQIIIYDNTLQHDAVKFIKIYIYVIIRICYFKQFNSSNRL